jgi:hypothetical protein
VSRASRARLLSALMILLGTTSCATLFHRHRPEPATAGVPIEKRPTPLQPDTTMAVETKPVPAPAPTPAETEKQPAPAPQPSAPAPTPPVETAMSPEERKASLQRIVADTTAASGAVSKCAGKDLLPDQQSVYETTRSLLTQTRVAIVREELWRAESLARKARQLALSLECH